MEGGLKIFFERSNLVRIFFVVLYTPKPKLVKIKNKSQTSPKLPALARYPKGYFRFFGNLSFYRLLNARMRAVVLFVKKIVRKIFC